MVGNDIKARVRQRYAGVVAPKGSGCCSPDKCCAGPSGAENKAREAEKLGYRRNDIERIPPESIHGLGCGNPVAPAAPRPGETVLDLGAGAGVDAFLAAGLVGESGRVIGVDMTPEMVERATENARKHGYGNVTFLLGEIENLPLGDETVDLVLSNCVINLCPDKNQAFREAWRVLRPGGRMVISDIVTGGPLPEALRDDPEKWCGCLAGAQEKKDYLAAIEQAGFEETTVLSEYPWRGGADAGVPVSSVTVRAVKRAGR